ncbi:TPM domain-containing protein [Mycobacterium sp. SM1]|uniref:TPM domain-containing protein n=1 Tax=Mycobacterium sp. SM1 TaxID=2816243 RepID=UPI001BD0AC8E|nr:TPM domain-containing protein [Mycobacterium sp. SM1]MBS4727137.1 TPM domain-containing protein [Mycobacterium sp. SM1]
MRVARLLAVFLALAIAGPLAPAAAQPPLRLPGYLTDDANALTGSGRAAVQSAIDRLYADRRIRLWVVYVDTFSGQGAVSWAQSTRRVSDLGDFDALLAVATVDRSYAFLVPSTVTSISARQVEDLRRDRIEPALRRGDWSGAAVAAANGLNGTPASSGWMSLLAALGVVAIGLLALLVVMGYRRRRRRAAELAAARQVDPTDPDALSALSLDALDNLSRTMVVDVDNALRTSVNELALATDEFGENRTEPFTRAVNNAKAALAEAFTVRHQLDGAPPESPAQRRELLTRVIVSAARADRELESQTEAFERLRDLVTNAPSRLDGLTQQFVELTARIAPAQQRLDELHREFDDAALTSVSGNVDAAKERLAFAEQSIDRARQLAARPVAGQQGGLVDAVRAAESALGQARALLDAVDSASGDIRHAVATLPSLIADLQAGIEHASAQLRNAQPASAPHTRDLAAARDSAAEAVAAARGSTDPLATFTQLTKAAAQLDRLLATVAEEQAATDRLTRAYEQALFTAQARVRAVSDYIDTRRGSVGPEARTRLAEAHRALQAAQDKQSTSLTEAITHANEAAALAAQAQSLANADVEAAQRAYSARYPGGGSAMGAMLGGIIIGDLLGGGFGGFGGGFGGGWSPTSYGGSPGPGDGGFLGGGGRF